jgi:hypothetical protein
MGVNNTAEHLELFEDIRDALKQHPVAFSQYAELGLIAQSIVSHHEDAEDPLTAVLESEQWKNLGDATKTLPGYLGAVAAVYTYFERKDRREGLVL